MAKRKRANVPAAPDKPVAAPPATPDSQKAVPSAAPGNWKDAVLLIAQLAESLLTALLHMNPTKPADPVAWEHLGRVDEIRRLLQRAAGVEPTEVIDPHGRVAYTPKGEGEK